MYDIAISYASLDRGAVLRVKSYLERQGLVVWMDDQAGESVDEAARLSAVGVAPGADHREVIEEAFLTSSLVLVADSWRWRESSYCQWEHQLAVDAGKRISVLALDRMVEELVAETQSESHIGRPVAQTLVGDHEADAAKRPPLATWPIETLEELLERFQVGLARAEAQSRLIAAARERPEDSRPTRIPNRSLVVDARTVMAGMEGTDGVTLDNRTLSFAEDLLSREAIWLRRRRWITAATAAAVVLLAIAAVLFWMQATNHHRAATRDAAVQDSLRLTVESRKAANTADQERLAKQASSRAATVQGRTAKVAADNQRQQHQIISAPPAIYRSARLSADGSSLVTASASEVFRFSLTLGTETARVASGTRLGGGVLAVSANGRQVVAVDAATKRLLHIDMTAKSVTELTKKPVAAFATGTDDTLWWLDQVGTLNRQPWPWSQSATRTAVTLPMGGSAIAVDRSQPDTVVVLHTDGRLVIYRPAGTSAGEGTATRLFGASSRPHAITDDGSGAIDEVLSCPAGLVAMRSGTFAGIDKRGHRWVVKSTEDPEAAKQNGASSIGCIAEGGVAISGASSFTLTGPDGTADPVRLLWRGLGQTAAAAFGDNRSYVTSGTRSGGAVLTGDGTRVAVVNWAGGIDVISLGYAPASTSVRISHAVVPIGAVPLLVTPDGKVYDAMADSDAAAVADLGGAVRPQEPVVTSSDVAWLATDTGIVALRRGVGVEVEVARCAIPEQLRGQVKGIRSASHDAVAVFADREYAVIELAAILDANQDCVLAMKPVPGLSDGEAVFNLVRLTQGRIAVATSNSRVLLIEMTNAMPVAEVSLGVAFRATYIASLADGGLLAAGGDGVLVRYDQNLKAQTAALVPGGILMLSLTPDGKRALVRNVNGSITVMDVQSLNALQALPSIVGAVLSTFVPDSRNESVWGLGLRGGNATAGNGGAVTPTGMTATIVRYPLLAN